MTPTERPIVPFPSIVPSEPTARHRVLLVDDDDAVRDMMTATLERTYMSQARGDLVRLTG